MATNRTIMLALFAAALLALPPTDRLIDASGVTLHIQCDGLRQPGAPLVVLEAGAGNGAKTWRDVFGPIAQFARVCAYDRPGLGSSAHTREPQGIIEVVETLHALLRAADERPPFVMAGHSYGGMMVRLFASRHPDEVTGLVLIDSSHEEQVRRFGAGPPNPVERFDLAAACDELAKAPWKTDIPLVVLTRTPPSDPQADPRSMIWQELQRELATRSSRAEHIVAKKSGHYIQNDDPPLVIDAVRRVVARAAAHP